MVAALVRIQFDLDGSGVFVDPPADRVIGNIRGREGRNVARLGGPDIPSQCTAVTLVLNNHDGYYTEGAGADLGPGSRMRVQWKAQASDAWVTRFQGSLSELSIRFTGFSFALTRWLGPLYRFTSGNIPGRLILNQTPQSIMGVLADAAGVAANDREFDTDATLYNRLLSPGYVGVQEVQGMLSAFIYDTPDGKVRMELPATRRAKSTVARYTDGDATAAEIGIPPPRRLTRPFGIINHVDGEYQYYIPAGNTTDTRSYTMAAITQQEFRQTPDLAIAYTRSIPVSDPIPAGASVPSFSFPFTIGEDYSTVTVDALNANFRSVPTLSFLHSYAEIRVTGFVLTPGRTSITMQYTMRIGRDDTTPADPYGLSVNFGNGSITLQSGMSFEQTIEHFPRELEDSASILRYGYRPRPSPW